jgi:hypothetical protein
MLAVPKRGWENEHLAAYLLSQIAFIGHPLTVSDDVGSDFICTLFEATSENGIERLFPRRSFAIQIKSNLESIQATNKIDYLLGLELPFFVGVIERSLLRLSIFSGDFLPVLFSHYGTPSSLSLVLDSGVEIANPYEGSPEGPCTLRLRHVCDLSASDPSERLREKATTMSGLCKRMHGNLSSLAVDEYIFRLDDENRAVNIAAGPCSVLKFRYNFYLRLAEAFYNFEWILENPSLPFDQSEFEIYERLFNDLVSLRCGLPPVLEGVYRRVKDKLG